MNAWRGRFKQKPFRREPYIGTETAYPPELPNLRRRVVVTDFDFGVREVVADLYKSPRQDCYTVVIGGEIVADLAGWSSVLEIIRPMFPRVRVI